MNFNLLAGLQYESLCVIYAVMAFMVLIGRRSTKMFYSIVFSLLIAGLTTGFYMSGNVAVSFMFAFVISFILNLVVSLFAFAITDKIDPDSTFSYLLIWELLYNGSYFMIVFLVNLMIK